MDDLVGGLASSLRAARVLQTDCANTGGYSGDGVVSGAPLLGLLSVPGGGNIAAILLMLLGTQWYLLFNIIARVGHPTRLKVHPATRCN